jgi:hypothetical protein
MVPIVIGCILHDYVQNDCSHGGLVINVLCDCNLESD